MLAGRGYGKTRVGAETVRRWVQEFEFVNAIGPTAAAVRDIMVEGESGLLTCWPPYLERPDYQPSKARITWPTGAKTELLSAEDPDRARGYQHQRLWADELAAWAYPTETWDQLTLGLRLGPHPRAVITTTPQPIRIIRDLVASPLSHVTRGSSYENLDNLGEAFRDIIRRYEGTRLGRQELYAELLDDVPGALWSREMVDAALEAGRAGPPHLDRIVIGVDPQASSDPETGHASTGIVAAGFSAHTGYYWVLDDLTVSGKPAEWAAAAVSAYRVLKADTVIAEKNNGGEMVGHTIRTVDKNVPVKLVSASRGKRTRAEPIAALYEQGRVRHARPMTDLDDQLCTWMPDSGQESPDRMDALVWALTELMLGGGSAKQVAYRGSLTPPRVVVGDFVLVGEHYIDKP